LAYLYVEDDARAPLAWDSLRTSLKLATPVIGAAIAHAGVPSSPNVLNGRALHLVQPPYPIPARQAHANGTVIVQVVINEEGNVISAKAISGPPLLQQVSVAAAAASKFSPTKLCEEPVRVSGVIQYRFVAM
jgi:protein TonB